ncbi:response regulator, partial [bacterium]|nr:response regulator [bacterium]
MSNQPRILFVDDEAQILKSIRRHFLDEPYEVLTANSGKEGLKIMEDTPAEVVVSDYRMPEMNGGEFLKRVSERWPETSRLVLSGHADLGSIITAINDGEIFKFIGKPWNDQELKIAVRDGVEKYHSLINLKRVAGESLTIAADLLQESQDKRDEIHSRNLHLEKEVRTLRKYEAVFNSLNTPIVFFDKEGGMMELNIAALHFFEEAG